ncbi:TatD family hydrolase [Ningiella sp. W23]|uniref:TatD family hydrolase n=1 Tax=Ningiella sp. W23 TaxID=3023715 RepID=UPI0037579DB5
MIDSHCHIDLPAFDKDRDEVIRSAQANGVSRILVPGLDFTQVQKLLVLKKTFPLLDIAAGFHPYYLDAIGEENFESQLGLMSDWIAQHIAHIVAIGEFGMDGSLRLNKAFQERVFVSQLRLASAYKLPVILHHRQSHNDLIRLLKQEKFGYGGVVHAFSGSEQIAQTYIDMGFCLGVGGTITYPRGAKTRLTLAKVSVNALMLETDAPDMPIYGYQGQRNTPQRLGLIADAIADVMQMARSELVEVTTANYLRVFSSGPSWASASPSELR